MSVDAHWETFFQSYRQLGDSEIASRNEDMMRLLKENGVTYNIYGEPSGLNRPWKLDLIPFLIDREEWETVEVRAETKSAVAEPDIG